MNGKLFRLSMAGRVGRETRPYVLPTPAQPIPKGVKGLVSSRHPGENRGPVCKALKTLDSGFRRNDVEKN
jgi:hypothetical protein